MSTSYGRRDGPVITFAECPMIIDALEKTANDFLCAPGRAGTSVCCRPTCASSSGRSHAVPGAGRKDQERDAAAMTRNYSTHAEGNLRALLGSTRPPSRRSPIVGSGSRRPLIVGPRSRRPLNVGPAAVDPAAVGPAAVGPAAVGPAAVGAAAVDPAAGA